MQGSEKCPLAVFLESKEVVSEGISHKERRTFLGARDVAIHQDSLLYRVGGPLAVRPSGVTSCGICKGWAQGRFCPKQPRGRGQGHIQEASNTLNTCFPLASALECLLRQVNKDLLIEEHTV